MLLIIQQFFKNEANLYSDRKRFSKDTAMGRCITVHECSMYIIVYSKKKKKGYTNTTTKGKRTLYTYMLVYA